MMKKVLLALTALTLLSQVYLQSKSKSYEDLIVLIVLESTKPSSSTNRAPALCPVDGYYHKLTSMVELSFKQDLGTVYVTLDNLTTGETYDYSGSSAAGTMMMPTMSNSCYTMNITTESGRVFKSSFATYGVDDED